MPGPRHRSRLSTSWRTSRVEYADKHHRKREFALKGTLLRSGVVIAAVGLLALAFFLGRQGATSAQTMKLHAVDAGFAQFMSLHHEQAIRMAQLMLDGRPTTLAPLAQRIASAQLREIGEMQGWLKLWGQPLEPENLSMTWMLLGDTAPGEELRQYLLDCEHSPTGMPGLATPAELEELQQLAGDARDRRFLQLMRAHHVGGIPMARFAAEHAHFSAVRELAHQIVHDQTEEVQDFERSLARVISSR